MTLLLQERDQNTLRERVLRERRTSFPDGLFSEVQLPCNCFETWPHCKLVYLRLLGGDYVSPGPRDRFETTVFPLGRRPAKRNRLL